MSWWGGEVRASQRQQRLLVTDADALAKFPYLFSPLPPVPNSGNSPCQGK
jgi:hypothetical protein